MAMEPSAATPDNDQTLRDRATRVLRLGFRSAVVIMAIGLALALIEREPLPTALGNPGEIARGVRDGNPGSIVGVGILVIILTPFVSTLAIALTFREQGNARYAMISSLVLFILLGSIGLSLI
jgi:uncharacterized membrane protein